MEAKTETKLEYFYCDKCKTYADPILTPEPKGTCVFCGFNEFRLRMQGFSNKPNRKYGEMMYGKCNNCGREHEIVVGTKIYCSFCKLYKGEN